MLGLVGYGSAIASHLAGGGLLPSGPALLLLGVASVAAASVLTRKELRTSRIVIAVVVAQGVWHAALSALAGHVGEDRLQALTPRVIETLPAVGAGATQSLGRRTGSMYDAYEALLPATSSTPGSLDTFLAHQVAHIADQGVAMVGAHLLGAVGLGLYLGHGEVALWRLLRLAAINWSEVASALRAGAAVDQARACQAPAASRVVAYAPVAVRTGSWVESGLRRRGPPVLLAA